MRPVLLVLSIVPLLAAADPHMLPREWGQAVSVDAVRVIAPDRWTAAEVASLLQAVGSEVVVTSPADAMDESELRWRAGIADRTVIVVGGIHTNRAMLPLYSDYLAFGDAAYPGEDGYVIRTIDRPLGEGTAAISLEASEARGVERAIESFGRLLQDVEKMSLSRTLEARLGVERSAAVAGLSDAGQRYVLSGDPAEATRGIEALMGRIDAAGSFFAYGDYGIERYIREYCHLQDAPGATSNQILALDEALLQTALKSAPMWWRWSNGRRIGSRHQTMGTSSFTATVRLLRRRGVGNEDAARLLEQWWSESESYWRNACSTFHDDLEGIPSYYSCEPTLDWALMMGFGDYLRQQLPLAAERACVVVDSLGNYAGTGTYEECRPGDVYKAVPRGWLLSAADFFHHEGGYGWVRDNVPGAGLGTWGVLRSFGGTRAFAGHAEPSPMPAHWLGITALPLGAYRYSRLPAQSRESFGVEGGQETTPPSAFEKLCLRDSFEPEGQYLVFQGYQGASADNQPARDANSLVRYSDLGHVWLHSNSPQQGKFVRSAVYCSDGLNTSDEPQACVLQAMYCDQRLGLVASHFPGLNACDWTRNIIWLRGRYFAVIDLLQQRREGAYSLTCSFRTPQQAHLTGDGMVAREGRARMRIRNADGVRLSVDGGAELDGAAVPTLLRCTQLLDGAPGTLATFRNLVYSTDPEHDGDLEVRAVGAKGALIRGRIRGEDELALVGAGPRGERLRIGPFETDGQVLYVGGGGQAQAGGSSVMLQGRPITQDEEGVRARVLAALEQLWDESSPVERGRAVAGEAGGTKARWRYDGFPVLRATCTAPVLACDPEGSGNSRTLLDRIVTRWATVRWPRGADVALSLDLLESVPIAQIDFQSGLFGRHNVIPDEAKYPGPRVAIAEFSDDNFEQDIRRSELTFRSDCTFEDCHKGVVYPILRWTCEDIDQTARHIRLRFAGEIWGALGMNELSVRPTGPSVVRVMGHVLRDVDGDGRPDILCWSDQGDLRAVSEDGRELLRKRLPGYITSAECYPELGADGGRILVTTREARLYCLAPDGTELWKTDFIESAELNSDLPTAYSIGLLKRPDGTPLIVTGNYNLACFVSPDGEVLQYQRLPAAYQTMTLSRGADYDGDGVEDIVSTEVWGCLSVLDANMRRTGGARLPRGKGILLEYFGPPATGSARAVVCSANGVGLLDLGTLDYKWQHGVKPIADCVLGDVNNDGRPEVVLAKEDGYLLVYDEEGVLSHRELLGEPARAATVVRLWDGAPAVAVALPDRIALWRPGWTTRTIATGSFSRLACLGDGQRLVGFGQGGIIEAWDLSLEP